MPTNGTYWSIENTFPPTPFDPFPDLPLYTDGTGNYFYSNPDSHHWGGRHGSHGGRVTADDSPPDPGISGGSGGTPYAGVTNAPPDYPITTNYNDYSCFWLSITNDATNAYVSVMNTLPGFGYTVLTNYDLTTTNWGVFYTFTATNSISPCPAVPLDANQLYFNAKLNLGGGSLWVCTNVTPAQMVSWLMGTNFGTVTNITYTGCGVAIGVFTNAAMVGSMPGYPGLAFDRGIIISTGWVTNALGPNYNDGENGWVYEDDTDSISNQYGESASPSDLAQYGTNYSDSDLNVLVDGNGINDSAVLEFDIITTNSFQLSFNYIYASEEYPEWIGTFNDPFAIFVSTNQVSGEWQNGITNDIALVPGTNLAVIVNNINGGCTYDENTEGQVSVNNPQFYIDNHGFEDDMDSFDAWYSVALLPYAAPTPVYNLQYDGFTVPLVAQTNIVVGVTNHIKIAIGDCYDWLYDSAVFIKAAIPADFNCE